MTCVLVHGSGHKASSWNETISYMNSDREILCPNLSSILNGREAIYDILYVSFAEYCNKIDGQIDLCGLSSGGILALNYTLDFPDKVNRLVLIGTPHRIPKLLFAIQNIVFRFLPESVFANMAFGKKDTFTLGNSLKQLDFIKRLHSITCSTLVICGKKDGANIRSAQYLADNIKNAKITILENIGHIVNEENPKVLAKELTDFYNSNK